MIPKTIILHLAILAACSYAVTPISANTISTLKSGVEHLDEDESDGLASLLLATERYLEEENVEFQPDRMLEVMDRTFDGMEGKITERGLFHKLKRAICRAARKVRCRQKRCTKLKKGKWTKCVSKCKKKAKKKC